jgi:hypothetical protein
VLIVRDRIINEHQTLLSHQTGFSEHECELVNIGHMQRLERKNNREKLIPRRRSMNAVGNHYLL